MGKITRSIDARVKPLEKLIIVHGWMVQGYKQRPFLKESKFLIGICKINFFYRKFNIENVLDKCKE